jgi:hypothetical protein
MKLPVIEQKKEQDDLVRFENLLSFFSIGLIISYAFTWGYIYELGIPESPDISKAAYFFTTVFATTIFQGIIDYLFSDNLFYREIGISLVIIIPIFLIIRKFFKSLLCKPILYGKKICNWFSYKKSFVFLSLVPFISILLMQINFFPTVVYVHRLHKWILFDISFIFYSVGLLCSFLTALLFPYLKTNLKNNVKFLLWIFLILYGATNSFFLSKAGLKFMFFPIGITEQAKQTRYPHLWFSEKGRYIALCNEESWRLVGVNYDNKDFFTSDPRYDQFNVVCRFKTPWK